VELAGEFSIRKPPAVVDEMRTEAGRPDSKVAAAVVARPFAVEIRVPDAPLPDEIDVIAAWRSGPARRCGVLRAGAISASGFVENRRGEMGDLR
jgi:hypothetical protein